MKPRHAIVHLDHHQATILTLDEDPAHVIKSHPHETRQHANAVRSEHAFFDDVCKGLNAFKEVVVAGSHIAITDFKNYAHKHWPEVSALVQEYVVVDKPTDAELQALARTRFVKIDNMLGDTAHMPK